MKYKKFKSVLYTFLLSVLFFSVGCEKCESGYDDLIDSVWIINTNPEDAKEILIFTDKKIERYSTNDEMKVSLFHGSYDYHIKNGVVFTLNKELMKIGDNTFSLGTFRYFRSGKKRADFFSIIGMLLRAPLEAAPSIPPSLALESFHRTYESTTYYAMQSCDSEGEF